MTTRNRAIGLAALVGIILLTGCSSSESGAGAVAAAPDSAPAPAPAPAEALVVATQWGPLGADNKIPSEPGHLYDPDSPEIQIPSESTVDLSENRHGHDPEMGWVLKHTAADAPDGSHGTLADGVVWYEHPHAHAKNQKYIAFGTWVDDSSGDIPSLHTFYLLDSGREATASELNGKAGTATFVGRSLGFFRNTDVSDKIYRTSSDLAMRADFEDYTIFGSLYNFRVLGKDSDEDWVLHLVSRPIATTGEHVGFFGDGEGTEGLLGTVEGSYRGAIWTIAGPSGTEFGLVGTYDGRKDGMHLVGVFGAVEE